MKPILFNTEMVKAILDGRKTVTRRPLKQPFEIHPNGYITKPRGNERLCPYEPQYQRGDILYVRETWQHEIEHAWRFNYKATDNGLKCGKWRPSIHMPKKAARIFLKVTDVRVERVQAINSQGHHDDVLKEGITVQLSELDCGYTPSHKFRDIWQNLYGDWDANPWVWVYEFEVVPEVQNDN